MIEALRTCLTRFGELTATPAAFGIFLAYVCYGQSGDEFGRCDFFLVLLTAVWAWTVRQPMILDVG